MPIMCGYYFVFITAPENGWNWDLAKNAFETHRKQFIQALVAETVRLKLGGVDIDFEGKRKV